MVGAAAAVGGFLETEVGVRSRELVPGVWVVGLAYPAAYLSASNR